MSSPLRTRARRAARTAGFAALTGTFVPVFSARMRLAPPDGPERRAVRDRWMQGWTRSLLHLFAIDLVVVGQAPPPTGGRIIIANHRSAIDIGAMLAVFGGEMVARHDLAEWPVIGRGARVADTIFVDRGLPQSGALAMRVVQRRLAEGRLVHLFAEGTTFDGDLVRPFHPGAFVAALAAKAEILPVGLAYPASSQAAYVNESFPEHLSRLAGGPPSRMGMAIGTPFSPERGERAAALAERCRGLVQDLVTTARGAVGA